MQNVVQIEQDWDTAELQAVRCRQGDEQLLLEARSGRWGKKVAADAEHATLQGTSDQVRANHLMWLTANRELQRRKRAGRCTCTVKRDGDPR